MAWQFSSLDAFVVMRRWEGGFGYRMTIVGLSRLYGLSPLGRVAERIEGSRAQ
ncbi:MAG: hypothetical protein ACKVII_07875 [Planctomycetales bacterium]|jgi:hypothetical protein